MLDLKKLFSAKMPTVAELERASARVRTELEEARTEADTLGAGRRTVLLAGSDDELIRHDEKVAAAARRRDRADAALAELGDKLDVARKHQAEDEHWSRRVKSGVAIPTEMTRGKTAATFEQGANTVVAKTIVRRLGSLL